MATSFAFSIVIKFIHIMKLCIIGDVCLDGQMFSNTPHGQCGLHHHEPLGRGATLV